MTKMTNVTAIETAIAIISATEGYDTELVEKLGKIRDSFKKKSGGEKKPTATQLENEKLKVDIVDFLTEGG